MEKQKFIDILPGEGLGELKFGMTTTDVQALIGTANETETLPDEDGNPMTVWHYDELELSCTFEGPESILMTMAVGGEDYELLGESLIGLPKDELILRLNEMEIEDFEEVSFEEDDEPMHAIICHDIDVAFYIDEEEVSEIQWGPYTEVEDDDDEISGFSMN
jgi:hypothetical protein